MVKRHRSVMSQKQGSFYAHSEGRGVFVTSVCPATGYGRVCSRVFAAYSYVECRGTKFPVAFQHSIGNQSMLSRTIVDEILLVIEICKRQVLSIWLSISLSSSASNGLALSAGD